MPRNLKLNRGDRIVSAGAPINVPDGTKVYEVSEGPETGAHFNIPHIPVTLDAAREAESQVFWVPEEDCDPA